MIDKEKVKQIAKLARLRLSEKEIEQMQKELSLILEHFEKLKEVDTLKTKPMFYPVELKNVVREDEPKKEKVEVAKIIELFPDKRNGFLKVKKVI